MEKFKIGTQNNNKIGGLPSNIEAEQALMGSILDAFMEGYKPAIINSISDTININTI